jgi:hypothetical protein
MLKFELVSQPSYWMEIRVEVVEVVEMVQVVEVVERFQRL